MVKIKIDIVQRELGGEGEVKKKKSFLLPFTWLNPFRWRRRKQSKETGETISLGQEKEADERPEGWIHPPLP